MAYDRFKHEEAVMDAWGILEELEALQSGIKKNMPTDDILAALRGLKVIYGVKFDLLFEQFEASFVPRVKVAETGDE